MSDTQEPRSAVMDFGLTSLKVRAGERGLELSLERGAGGQLTEACRAKVADSLRSFFPPGSRAVACALPARGVSVRHLAVPRVSREELHDLLALQLERELPLPPDELAWGVQVLSAPSVALQGDGAMEAVTVAALRRETVEQYANLLEACGLTPTFTVGALAAVRAFPRAEDLCGVLDIGKVHSEFLALEMARPSMVRSLSWGGDTLTAAIARHLTIDETRAEQLKLDWCAGRPSLSASKREAVATASREAVTVLAGLFGAAWTFGNGAVPKRRIILVGKSAGVPELPRLLTEQLGGAVVCERGAVPVQEGISAVTVGLENEPPGSGEAAPPALRAAARKRGPVSEERKPSVLFWAVAVIVLAVGALALRYVVPLVRMPDLTARLNRAQTLRDALPPIDRELAFLTQVEESHVPYLEAVAALVERAPPGTVLTSITLNRQGDVIIGGAAPPLKSNEFRGRLARSEGFSRVVLIDERPSKKRSGHMDFQITARMASDSAKFPPAKLNAPAGQDQKGAGGKPGGAAGDWLKPMEAPARKRSGKPRGPDPRPTKSRGTAKKAPDEAKTPPPNASQKAPAPKGVGKTPPGKGKEAQAPEEQASTSRPQDENRGEKALEVFVDSVDWTEIHPSGVIEVDMEELQLDLGGVEWVVEDEEEEAEE